MKYYIVDAFADHPFEGNPAAVCVLDEWLDDELMQLIAIENNLSETAFAVKKNTEVGEYRLRWFTPGGEVDLCGHATLATSYVIDTYVEPIVESIKFTTLSGILEVKKSNGLYEMDFPSRTPEPVELTEQMVKALGVTPKEAYLARDLILLLDSASQVRNLKPNFSLMKEIPLGLVCVVTAKGDDCDFVSRSFCPKLNVNEDPVCGSAHSSLIPFWSCRLNKFNMVAKQLSKRDGTLYCENAGERVKIAGKAVLYADGTMHIE